MDALQVTFSNTLLGRLYVLLLYAMAAFAVVSQLENTVIVWLFLLLLLILFTVNGGSSLVLNRRLKKAILEGFAISRSRQGKHGVY